MPASTPRDDEVDGSASASHLRRLISLAGRLSGALRVRDVAQVVATAGAEELGADSVTVYLLDDAGEHMHLAASAGMNPGLQQRFATIAVSDPLPGGDALRSQTPVCYQTVAERNARYRQFEDHPHGSGTVIVAPMVLDDAMRIGVVSIGWFGEHRATPRSVAFTQAVADLCGQAVHRARLYDWQRQSYQTQRFMVEATRLLNASLDLDATLQQVARMAVPDIVDVCAVCLAGDDDTLRPVVAASDDPDQQVVLDKLLARQPVIRNPLLLEIAASGEGVLMPVLDATGNEEQAEDADHFSLMQALEATSALVVPLRTRARTIGLLLLLMTGGSRPLAEPDLVLAQDLAG
ncbi:MAG TPA: GAF domain-containing protein, partial [Euzebya sp.]|nr:GAF domain-containing protein [Euzebya sp.]